MMALEDVLCKKLPNNEKIRAVKRECFNDVRYESRNLDFMVNGYLAQKGKWYHYDRPLGLLNIERGDSLTKARRKANQQLSIERAHHLEEYLLTFGEQMKQSCVTRYAALCYGAALGLLLEGEKDKALKWATEMCASDKRYISYWLLHKLTYLPFGTFVMRFGFKLKKILKL